VQRPFRDAAWFYAEYRYRPSEEFVRRLAAHLGWSSDDRILDLGAGPAHVSLRLAPFVGEVVVMDPEPAMIDEGRRRAEAAAADNLTFVVGGSDDLTQDLGSFATVVISQAFHWMRDQDAVLRALEPITEAVALVGYVKDPDYNRIWLDRPPWSVVGDIARRHLAAGQGSPHDHDPFPEILGRSSFSRVELLTYEYATVVEPTVDAAIGLHYSFGNLLPRLGDGRAAFESEVRSALADADTSPIAVELVDSALLGRR
jgi:SAM-dependent methyltransferase